MKDLDVAGAEVTVVHYGERSGALADELAMRGARLNELCLYEWRLPEDIGPLQDLARAIVKREVDAVDFHEPGAMEALASRGVGSRSRRRPSTGTERRHRRRVSRSYLLGSTRSRPVCIRRSSQTTRRWVLWLQRSRSTFQPVPAPTIPTRRTIPTIPTIPSFPRQAGAELSLPACAPDRAAPTLRAG